MLREIRLQNFKGWKDTETVHLAPITLFFGANSSGKTSLLQSMLLLKQTSETADRTQVLFPGDEKSLVDLGTPDDLITGHDRSAPLEFSLSWNPISSDFPKGNSPFKDAETPLTFDLRIMLNPKTGAPIVDSLTYRIDGREVGMRRVDNANEWELFEKGFRLKRTRGRPWPLPQPVRFYGFPDEVQAYYQKAATLTDYPLALEKLLGRIHYVGPLREFPRRLYLWAGQRPDDVGPRGDYAIPALLAARSEELTIPRGEGKARRYDAFEEVIANWLKRLGIIDSFEVRPIGKNRKEFEVRVRRSPRAPEVLVTDVGFGVSQVLPVLVQAFYASAGSTVLFEQPELHLHPRVQSELADALIDASQRCNVQFIIESHSEHFLRRLQRRIAEGELPSDHVAAYSCELNEGLSRLERLQIDDVGNVLNWPQDFFGDELGDLLAMNEAVAARQENP